MNVMKRVFVFTFIFVLVIGLTACGSSKSATGTGNAKSKSDTTTTNSTKDSSSKTKDSSTAQTNNATAKTNLHGRTITIAAWWDLAPKSDSLLGKEMIAQQKKVEQEYNVKIKYVNAGWQKVYDKLVSSVLANQPYADVVRLTENWALSGITKGLLQPVSSYAPGFSKYSKKFKQVLPYKGTYYGFDAVNDGSTAGIFYNLDIMKKYNLPDPQQLAKEGKWNWSEFEKLAKQATIDTNGDGKTDVWGLAGWDIDVWTFFTQSNNAVMVDSNGKVNLANQNMIEALSFYQKLVNTDHVWELQKKSAPDSFQERKTFGQGHAFMTPYYDWGVGSFKTINYGFVPFPTGPHGKGFVSPGGDPDGWTIPKGIKNPEAVMEVYNALQDVKPIEDYPNQTAYEKEFKRQSDIDWARKVNQHEGESHQGDYNNFPTGKILTDILDKKQNVTAVLTKYQPQAKSIVDKILNPSK